MAKYRKKPVVIDAFRHNGNVMDAMRWCVSVDGKTEWRIEGMSIYIPTLEGEMRADPGDWIIKGVKGEFYPCKHDIFETTYDEVSA